jgi:hypothetical protein
MGKLGRVSRILLLAPVLCIALSYYAIWGPGGSPDRVGSALVTLLGIIAGLMTWSASLVLAILSIRAREAKAVPTLILNLLALPVALVAFGIAVEFGFG